MFLLIQNQKFTYVPQIEALHSNMFLLIQLYKSELIEFDPTLHSNMFLLIHIDNCRFYGYTNFTFQYVSINTIGAVCLWSVQLSLHSNMFLLILGPKKM